MLEDFGASVGVMYRYLGAWSALVLEDAWAWRSVGRPGVFKAFALTSLGQSLGCF